MMAQVQHAPRTGIEDEMVGAAMQISLLRQEVKNLKLAVATSHDEIAKWVCKFYAYTPLPRASQEIVCALVDEILVAVLKI